MSDFQIPEQPSQNIFSNVSAEKITTGDITQIFKIFVNLDQVPKPQGIPQNIISSSTDKFVGRERDLENLNQQLKHNNQVVIAAVEGMGGVGKTELAIQYSLLNLQLDTYPGGICWIRAREQDIGLQIVSFARTDLDLTPPDDLELPDRVRWCWKRWQEKKEGNVLIVLDDVKDYDDIESYLPPQPSQFKILITTGQKLDLPNSMSISMYLEELSEEDALVLLGQLVGEEEVEQKFETAKELCYRLSNLPLALQLVGRYLEKHTMIDLNEELRRLKKKGLNQHQAVKATFELNWKELCDSERHLGCLLSFFSVTPIQWDLIEKLEIDLEDEAKEDALIKLQDLFLISTYNANKYIWKYLIRSFFKEKSEELEQYNFREIVQTTLRNIVENNFPDIEDYQQIKKKDVLVPHLKHILEQQGNNDDNKHNKENIAWINYGLGEYYNSQGLFLEAIRFYQESWSYAKTNSTSPVLINNLLKLAELDKEKKQKYYSEALHYAQNNFPENHIIFAAILNGLAQIEQEKKYFERAIKKYWEAVNIYKINLEKRNNNKDRLFLAITLDNLGKVYVEIKEVTKAYKYHEKSLEILNKILTVETKNKSFNLKVLEHKSRCLFNLAICKIEEVSDIKKESLDKEKLDLSFLYLKEGLKIAKDIWGEKNPKILDFLKVYIELCIKIDYKEEVKKKHEELCDVYNTLIENYNDFNTLKFINKKYEFNIFFIKVGCYLSY